METQELQTTAGETFVVRLRAAGGAGYQWELQKLPEGVRLEASTREVSNEAAPGDAMTQNFRFCAVTPGEHRIVLIYKRAWESEAAATQIVSVKVL
jgi:predicted secreted protein